jgi:ABC-type transporter Mla maintaining outer membrane lipid asymmetry permease subunit MlaE
VSPPSSESEIRPIKKTVRNRGRAMVRISAVFEACFLVVSCLAYSLTMKIEVGEHVANCMTSQSKTFTIASITGYLFGQVVSNYFFSYMVYLTMLP